MSESLSTNNINSNLLLNKIVSKYLLQNIFNYIKNQHYKYKLFLHSKYFQKKLEINYIDYQNKYYDKLGIYLYKYVLLDEESESEYNKNNKKKNLEEILTLNKIIFQSYIFNYFQNYISKNKDLEQIIIDIYSPLLDYLLTADYFPQIFAIGISGEIFQKKDLKNDYDLLIKKMNKLNINYSIIFEFKDSSDINFFKDLNINLNNIKKLTINQANGSKINDYNFLYNTLFSFPNILDNIIYLDFKISFLKQIDSNLFKNINNFKKLEELNLNGFKFNKEFTLDISSLKKLNLRNCENIILNQKCCLNITKLTLLGCKIFPPKNLLKFPNLEECHLQDEFLHSNHLFSSIIDFSYLKYLKIFEGETYDFINIKFSCLEKVILYSKIFKSDLKEIEKK